MRTRRSSPDDSVDVLVEVPRGSRNKYEYDDKLRLMRLDRVLYSSVHYPTDYGFIPGTLAPDGDHLDALMVVEEPNFPGCLVPARPIGILEMRDERGLDHKILAVPVGDPRFAEVRDIGDLASHWLREIEAFFASYKLLQGIETEVLDWHGANEAWRVIEASRQAARKKDQRGAA
ncbi:MAG: inorganic diphosphatase [Bacteroidetes bacterium]|nr:inorganic diphosphatase [Bacteroidota bacterium]MCL5026748.1 inorganic diphosphatase [Chloroflexota bacterium]